ncbi:MAG: chemotaxis response regulator protein-glutamate methylesterase [Verrucomicrobiae bacterium]|nr:chemotaxis response regulator protein-glutamate methylesterase [Verrucomicrobiae bacterium]
MSRIRTLIVDDSALVRTMLADNLGRDPDIEVVGTAVDPYAARDKILALDPDVITLDIEMPRMDGLTFLKRIMQHRPMPVVIMSSLTQSGSSQALEALQAGAVDVVAKPGNAYTVADTAELVAKIKAAALSRHRRRSQPPQPAAPTPAPVSPLPANPVAVPVPAPIPSPRHPAVGIPPVPESGRPPRTYPPRTLILMGASTGGTEALKSILTRLPSDLPGICVVQHIPAYFSAAFAERLNQLCTLEVREAQDGDRIQPGRVLVAPGGRHLLVRWVGSHYVAFLSDGPTVHHQRPAVDVLFDSALKAGAAPDALAVLLTGMGADGAAGMLRLKQAGTRTLAQDEATCVVFGMPREAIRMGAADEILPLDHFAARIDRHASTKSLN